MKKSGRRILMLVSICALFIFAGGGHVFAEGGHHEGGGEIISGTAPEHLDPSVTRQNIEDEEIREGVYRPKDYPYDDSLQNAAPSNEDDDSDDNDSDDDDDDDDNDNNKNQ
jgi:hypothetical protein